MSRPITGGEYRPRPDKDPYDDCRRVGWLFCDEIFDPLLEVEGLEFSEERNLKRAEPILASGEGTYVEDLGIIFGIAQYRGRNMYLTSVEHVKFVPFIPVTNQ